MVQKTGRRNGNFEVELVKLDGETLNDVSCVTFVILDGAAVFSHCESRDSDAGSIPE
jgi:hypothetical protein